MEGGGDFHVSMLTAGKLGVFIQDDKLSASTVNADWVVARRETRHVTAAAWMNHNVNCRESTFELAVRKKECRAEIEANVLNSFKKLTVSIVH